MVDKRWHHARDLLKKVFNQDVERCIDDNIKGFFGKFGSYESVKTLFENKQ